MSVSGPVVIHYPETAPFDDDYYVDVFINADIATKVTECLQHGHVEFLSRLIPTFDFSMDVFKKRTDRDAAVGRIYFAINSYVPTSVNAQAFKQVLQATIEHVPLTAAALTALKFKEKYLTLDGYQTLLEQTEAQVQRVEASLKDEATTQHAEVFEAKARVDESIRALEDIALGPCEDTLVRETISGFHSTFGDIPGLLGLMSSSAIKADINKGFEAFKNAIVKWLQKWETETKKAHYQTIEQAFTHIEALRVALIGPSERLCELLMLWLKIGELLKTPEQQGIYEEAFVLCGKHHILDTIPGIDTGTVTSILKVAPLAFYQNLLCHAPRKIIVTDQEGRKKVHLVLEAPAVLNMTKIDVVIRSMQDRFTALELEPIILNANFLMRLNAFHIGALVEAYPHLAPQMVNSLMSAEPVLATLSPPRSMRWLGACIDEIFMRSDETSYGELLARKTPTHTQLGSDAFPEPNYHSALDRKLDPTEIEKYESIAGQAKLAVTASLGSEESPNADAIYFHLEHGSNYVTRRVLSDHSLRSRLEVGHLQACCWHDGRGAAYGEDPEKAYIGNVSLFWGLMDGIEDTELNDFVRILDMDNFRCALMEHSDINQLTSILERLDGGNLRNVMLAKRGDQVTCPSRHLANAFLWSEILPDVYAIILNECEKMAILKACFALQFMDLDQNDESEVEGFYEWITGWLEKFDLNVYMMLEQSHEFVTFVLKCPSVQALDYLTAPMMQSYFKAGLVRHLNYFELVDHVKRNTPGFRDYVFDPTQGTKRIARYGAEMLKSVDPEFLKTFMHTILAADQAAIEKGKLAEDQAGIDISYLELLYKSAFADLGEDLESATILNDNLFWFCAETGHADLMAHFAEMSSIFNSHPATLHLYIERLEQCSYKSRKVQSAIDELTAKLRRPDIVSGEDEETPPNSDGEFDAWLGAGGAGVFTSFEAARQSGGGNPDDLPGVPHISITPPQGSDTGRELRRTHSCADVFGDREKGDAVAAPRPRRVSKAFDLLELYEAARAVAETHEQDDDDRADGYETDREEPVKKERKKTKKGR